jgi:hypothetical protein
MLAVIPKILSIDLRIMKGRSESQPPPPLLEVTVAGETTTSGWKNGGLSAWVYTAVPDDGFQDFTFIAERPIGIAYIVPSKITSTPALVLLTQRLKGVRIHASEGSVEKLIAGCPEVIVDLLKKDGQIPWPWGAEEIIGF